MLLSETIHYAQTAPDITNWYTLVVSLVGIITGGAGIKWYTTWARIRRQRRLDEASDSAAFKNDLMARVQAMSTKLEEMHEKQLFLVEQNAQLKAELRLAHTELEQLREEVKFLRNK